MFALEQRWSRLPYEIAAWLLEHGPSDRGETREWRTMGEWFLPGSWLLLPLCPTLAAHPTDASPFFPPSSAVFDLGNLWLEQQQQRGYSPPAQQAALAALVWRRPLAADFLACMAANLPWAANYVAPSPARPPRLPPSLDGRFSFTAEVSGLVVREVAEML